MPAIEPISRVDELDAAIAESKERPVLLFKHSRTCGISMEALDELRAHLDDSTTEATYKLITVQSDRQLANETSARLGIRHETPQAILLRNGRPVWTASHFRITKEHIEKELRRF